MKFDTNYNYYYNLTKYIILRLCGLQEPSVKSIKSRSNCFNRYKQKLRSIDEINLQELYSDEQSDNFNKMFIYNNIIILCQ